MIVETALLYRRVSTGHQDNSLEVQEVLNGEYCTRLQYRTEEFEDPDTSGSIPFLERAGARSLMHRLQQGGVLHVVTAKQDRLGRDTLDTIATIRAMWEMGVTPHFTAEGGALPRTAQNELLFEIKASVAQYERNLIRDRTRAVIRHKFSRGELTGKVPYGFDALYTFADGHQHTSPRALSFGSAQHQPEPLALDLIRAHGAVVRKQLVDNPAEQEFIREMAGMRERGWTLENIAKFMNSLGRPSKLGGLWQAGNVDRVLKGRHTQLKVLQAPPDSSAAAAA